MSADEEKGELGSTIYSFSTFQSDKCSGYGNVENGNEDVKSADDCDEDESGDDDDDDNDTDGDSGEDNDIKDDFGDDDDDDDDEDGDSDNEVDNNNNTYSSDEHESEEDSGDDACDDGDDECDTDDLTHKEQAPEDIRDISRNSTSSEHIYAEIDTMHRLTVPDKLYCNSAALTEYEEEESDDSAIYQNV